ncbi:uncharacterized protein LOC134834334 [Culicoides brevitarsis]|uniref:uncharacterized protein LOC134834334 n=1 Tax=Culicoides brevitarsis TaxID=469753 RepID=UPI00307CAA6A
MPVLIALVLVIICVIFFIYTRSKSNNSTIIESLGSSVKSLALDKELASLVKAHEADKIFEWIAKHLVNLESLSIQSFELNDARVIENFTPIMKRLKSLSLFEIPTDVLSAKCFKNTQLEELKVTNCKYVTENFFLHFNTLKSLTISSCRKLTFESYAHILKTNLGLKQLTIEIDIDSIRVEYLKITSLERSKDLVNFIATKLQEIEDLTMDFCCPNVYMFGDLPNLKKLKIISNELQDINKLLEKLSQKNIVEELEISGENLWVDIKCLRKMTNIKKLTLFGDGEFAEYIPTLIEPLNKLKELNIEYAFLHYELLDSLIQILKREIGERPKLQVQAGRFLGEESLLKKLLKDNKDIIEVRYRLSSSSTLHLKDRCLKFCFCYI